MSADVDLGRDVEIARLEWEVCQTAVAYVQGVGYDGSSLQAESDAVQRFVDSHNAFFAATKALIAARKRVEAASLYHTVPGGLPPPVINP